MQQKDTPVVSVTIKDCDVDTFTVSGGGGQHRDRKRSGARVTHRASGAVGVGRDERDFLSNRRHAFLRMAKTPKFKLWLLKEHMKATGEKTIEERLDEQMLARNLHVEVRDSNGKWVTYNEDS